MRLPPSAFAALAASGVVIERDKVTRIRTGPDGEVSGVELTDGRKIALPHAAADAVRVEVSAAPEESPAKHAK